VADFGKWFSSFTEKMEQFLFYLALFFIFLLLASQALMTNDTIRYYLSRIEQLEGVPLFAAVEDGEDEHETEGAAPVTSMKKGYSLGLKIVKMVEGAELYVMLNGKSNTALSEENTVIKVEPGDLIEISGNVPGAIPVEVIVTEVQGLANPQPGEKIYTFGERDLVGWAIPE
jgi:hypothetical protein